MHDGATTKSEETTAELRQSVDPSKLIVDSPYGEKRPCEMQLESHPDIGRRWIKRPILNEQKFDPTRRLDDEFCDVRIRGRSGLWFWVGFDAQKPDAEREQQLDIKRANNVY